MPSFSTVVAELLLSEVTFTLPVTPQFSAMIKKKKLDDVLFILTEQDCLHLFTAFDSYLNQMARISNFDEGNVNVKYLTISSSQFLQFSDC